MSKKLIMRSSQSEALLEKENKLLGDPSGLLTCTAYFMILKGKSKSSEVSLQLVSWFLRKDSLELAGYSQSWLLSLLLISRT